MQKEVEQWPVLLELACLLPHTHLHLLLVSPDVPQAWHCRSALFASPNETSCSGTECNCAHALHDAVSVRHADEASILLYVYLESLLEIYCPSAADVMTSAKINIPWSWCKMTSRNCVIPCAASGWKKQRARQHAPDILPWGVQQRNGCGAAATIWSSPFGLRAKCRHATDAELNNDLCMMAAAIPKLPC